MEKKTKFSFNKTSIHFENIWFEWTTGLWSFHSNVICAQDNKFEQFETTLRF